VKQVHSLDHLSITQAAEAAGVVIIMAVAASLAAQAATAAAGLVVHLIAQETVMLVTEPQILVAVVAELEDQSVVLTKLNKMVVMAVPV
jgi:hypothetical protein